MPLLSRTGRTIGVIICLSLLALALIWNQTMRTVENDRDKTLKEAIGENSNLAVSLEKYTLKVIENADAVLRLVSAEYEERGKSFNFERLFNKGLINQQFFNGVMIVDEKGNVIGSSLPDTSYHTANVSDREHFYFHRTRKNQLYIAEPLISRTIDKAVVILSRRHDKPDGSFGGTVSVQIFPSTFTNFYSNANMRKDDLFSLVSPNGITYARRKGEKSSYGEDISSSPLFDHLKQTNVGNYFAEDAIFGISTHFSFRKFDNYPIIVTVGSSEEEIFAGFHQRAKLDYWYAVMMTLLIGLFTTLSILALIQRQKYIKKIKNNESRYQSIFENTQDAIVVFREDNSIETMNAATFQLFNLSGSFRKYQRLQSLFLNADNLHLPSAKETNSKAELTFTKLNHQRFIGEVYFSSFEHGNGDKRTIMLIRDISIRKQMERKLLDEQKKYERELTRQVIFAQERERESIGHELHDNVNQILTTVKLYLEMAIVREDMKESFIHKSKELVSGCIDEIRNLSRELSAPTLGKQSFSESVESLIETIESSTDIKVQFTQTNFDHALRKDEKLALYRILQEQFNNIIKHSKATEVRLDIEQKNEQTKISICDNGKGFDLNNVRNGIGLNNILSRAKVFGGEMNIVSAPGKGCSLTVAIPLTCKEKNQANLQAEIN